MKRPGSTFEYEQQRNEDLLDAFRRIIADMRHIRMDEAMRKLVAQPAKRFYVSEERAAIVIAAMLKGKSIAHMRPNKQAMFNEILKRVKALQQKQPDATIYSLVLQATHQPAPAFYLTPGSAKVILSKIKRNHKTRKFFKIDKLTC